MTELLHSSAADLAALIASGQASSREVTQAHLDRIAEVDGEIVGQVTCSRGTLAGRPSVGLGPISVAPDHQRRGVGSALMEAALAAAEVTGEPVVVLLGDDADRAADHVVQRSRRIARAEHVGPRGVAAAVTQ